MNYLKRSLLLALTASLAISSVQANMEDNIEECLTYYGLHRFRIPFTDIKMRTQDPLPIILSAALTAVSGHWIYSILTAKDYSTFRGFKGSSFDPASTILFAALGLLVGAGGLYAAYDKTKKINAQPEQQ